MTCFHPVTAWYGKGVTNSGKRPIVFKRALSPTGLKLMLPCGRCSGCHLERSRVWAMRLMHEKRSHEHSSFLTLTYDNDHLPPGGTLVLRDLQLFMKRLRREIFPVKVKYFAAGEYGDRNARPHYHVILFGYSFGDKLVVGKNGRNEVYYESSLLRWLWPDGNNIIGDVTFDSCAYVARYILKKMNGVKASEHYAVVDGDGEVFDRLPEFTTMSNGIGAKWFAKYGVHAFQHDSVIVNGHECKPPRYYDNKYEALDPRHMKVVKANRRKKAKLYAADNTPDRLRVKEVLQLRKLQTLKRNV